MSENAQLKVHLVLKLQLFGSIFTELSCTISTQKNARKHFGVSSFRCVLSSALLLLEHLMYI